MPPVTYPQFSNAFVEMLTMVVLLVSSSQGFVHKLGGNKEDPYNLTKGTWSKRYLVLQDDLRYFVDEKTWRKGGAPKGIVSLDNFFVTREGGPGLFTIHAVPWPLICRVDDPAQVVLSFAQ